MIKKLYEMEYENLITNEQAYELRRLFSEGYDITPALKGKIGGIGRAREMDKCIRTGNLKRIDELIGETKQEELKEIEAYENHMREYKEYLKKISAQN